VNEKRERERVCVNECRCLVWVSQAGSVEERERGREVERGGCAYSFQRSPLSLLSRSMVLSVGPPPPGTAPLDLKGKVLVVVSCVVAPAERE